MPCSVSLPLPPPKKVAELSKADLKKVNSGLNRVAQSDRTPLLLATTTVDRSPIMFMLKSLFGKIWGDQNNLELIQIPSGSLYLVRPGSIKGARECIYKDAVAAIRRTPTPHNYQLVVTRAYEEGEEQLLEEEDESEYTLARQVAHRHAIRFSYANTPADFPTADDERSFLIDQELGFRLSKQDDERKLIWRDLQGDEDDLLEFVIDSKQVNDVTASIFEFTFLQCVYERKTGRTHEEASDEDLEKLKWGATSSTKAVKQDKEIATAAPKIGKSDSPSAAAATNAPAADKFEPEADADVVLNTTADLYLYDQGSGLFMVQQKQATATVIEAGRFLYWLSIRGEERQWLSQKVEAAMNMNFSPENLSAVWNYFDDQRRCFSWLLRFPNKAAYDAFHQGFLRYLWETLHEESWNKAKADEQTYMQVAYEQDEPMDVDEPAGADEGDESGDDTAKSDGRNEEDEEEVAAELAGDTSRDSAWPEQDEPVGLGGGQKEVNSQLAVGYKFDRSFVVRGDKIGVFRHTDDNRLEFDTTISKIATPKGKGFRPGKVMLHNQDASLVMMDPSNTHALYNMDLEYGKVVEEWKVHDDVPVRNVVPDSKYAQMTAEKTMIGHSHNGIFRIDPRISGNKLVDAQFKQYASKNDFSAAATDTKGRLAVASNKGDIRLFDAIGKNAKTALPALGDPIIGIDVTADGRYIIATCKTYLLLIDTLIGAGRYQGHLGFERSFPADSKPIPKRLTLKPSHVAYMGSEVSFTPARFDTGSSSETSIVTSTGHYVVSWSFSQVKKGNTAAYVLKRYGGEIIQDEHTYGSDQAIVVAFENDVQLASRSQLQKPTRKSLAPGR